jgi:serine/threonine-protein kinase
VLVDAAGGVKLCDFGLATDVESARAGRVGWLEGTPEHMAPEQALGGPVTTAADRWALAALAFELLTGARPYPTQPNAAKLLLHILERPPRRPRELGLAGDHVNRLFARALGRNVEARPRSSVELVSELEVALRTAFRVAVTSPDATASLPTQRVRPARLRVA